MTSSNRLSLVTCRESTLGTTPTTPRMRTTRITGESLTFSPEFVDSDEIRSDRMMSDPIKIMQASSGGINFELSYPDDNSPLSEFYRSALYNPWVNTAQRDNDGTADSVITGIDGAEIVTVTTGTAFVAGQLVRFSGFTAAANNGVFKVTTGSATVPAFVGSGIVLEAVPPAAARMKVVGFVGASADITALADGLGSTLLDFTTLGLVVGQWVKIGGTLDASQFAFFVTLGALSRAAAYARITVIAATKLTLDNLPAGWTTDVGTGKLIKVWFGDQIRNGVTQTSLSIERGFLGQTVPTYIVNTGMVANTLDHSITNKQKITGSVAFTGMGGSQGTVALDASPDAETTGVVMAAHSNVGRIAENGSTIGSPNWASDLSFQVANGNASIEAVDSTSPVGIVGMECAVTGKIGTYFGDNAVLTRFYNATATSINARVVKNNQAVIFAFPRVTLKGGGNPQATGKNVLVKADFDFTAAKDTVLTNAQILIDRMPYVE